jgi:hypothetical protein
VLAYAVALLVAVAVVPLTKGSFTRLAEIRFRRWGLFVAAVGIQILIDLVEIPRSQYETTGLVLLLASYVALIGFCISNLRTRGMALILAGVAMNTLVIALNAGMPYRVADDLPRETTVKHRPARDSDLLVALTDEITIGPPVRAAVSVGDIVLAVGLVELAYVGSRRPRRSARRGSERGSDARSEAVVDLTRLETDETIDLRDPERSRGGRRRARSR